MKTSIVVIISTQTEWQIVKSILRPLCMGETPYGQCYEQPIPELCDVLDVTWVQGGLGKISSAGSVQYAIDRWNPDIVCNLGTCGGFEGYIDKGTIILAEKTIVYDVIDYMQVDESSIDYYTTNIDLSWISEDSLENVRKTVIVSADHDLCPEEIPTLRERFNAVAGDWESGAIAWVANKNKKRILILRGVTDLVNEEKGHVYDNDDLYQNSARIVMETIINVFENLLRSKAWQS